MARTRQNVGQRLLEALGKLRSRGLGRDTEMELEEALILADVGTAATGRIMERLRERARSAPRDKVASLLREILVEMLSADTSLGITAGRLNAVLVVGVNGTGKTTTIGKLAFMLQRQGYKVILGAGDTFRAAGIEQLELWGKKVGVPVIAHREGADPAAVAFDCVKAALSRRYDVAVIDTAGRLHTKTNLMEELKKVRRVVSRETDGGPHEVLLVVDATTGQNAVQQAKMFKDAVGVTGVVLTKLDGTAKGGIAIAVAMETGIPVKLVGTGEGLEDLRPFDAPSFVDALLGGRS